MWAAFIFAVTYVGVAVGRIPWLLLDRTGIALLGAIAMVVSGAVAVDRAVGSIDVSTILLLYALMIISAQLRLGGFYTCIARRIAALCVYPRRFLLVCMGIGAFLSAILANDIICLAFTPVLAYSLLSARLNPMPFLLGLAVSSNIGSAATIIGNPQNMLIGQIRLRRSRPGAVHQPWRPWPAAMPSSWRCTTGNGCGRIASPLKHRYRPGHRSIPGKAPKGSLRRHAW